jgi:outer membrane protein TolC
MRKKKRFQILLLLVVSPVGAASAQEVVPDTPPPESSFDMTATIADGPALTSEEAVERAMATSPDLTRARALAEAAEAGVSQARARMLPRLDVSANYVHVDGFEDGAISLQADPDAIAAQRMLASMVSDPAAQALWNAQISATEATSSVSIEVPRDRINLGARLSWPVSDFFFAVMPSVDSAEHAAETRRHEEEASAAGVRRSVLEAYLNLVRARGAHGVALESRRQTETRVEEVVAAVHAGLLTTADELEARARLAATGEAVAAAAAGVEIADAALRTMIGADDGEVFGVQLDERDDVQIDYQAALDNRPELRALRAALDAQRAAARASDASGYPHLAVYAGADYGNPNRYQVPPTQQWTPSWEVGASLTWSPNDTLVAVHRGDQLSAEQQATEAQIQNVERMIRLELRRADAEQRAAIRGIEAAEASLAAAEAAYESRLAQLRVGNTTTSAVFDAKRQLDRARLSLLDAHVRRELANVRMAYAGGVL